MKLMKYYFTGLFSVMLFLNSWAQDGPAEVKIKNDSIFTYHMKNMGVERYTRKDPACHYLLIESQEIDNCGYETFSEASARKKKSHRKEQKEYAEKGGKHKTAEKKSTAEQTKIREEGYKLKQNN